RHTSLARDWSSDACSSARAAALSRHRGDADQSPDPVPGERPLDTLGYPMHAVEVDGLDTVPFLGGDLEVGHRRRDAGEGDQGHRSEVRRVWHGTYARFVTS